MLQLIDIAGLVLGLLYLWLEFKANIWLWVVGVIMPIVHGYLYFARGLYADFGMEIYYVLAAVYGFVVWQWGSGEHKAELPITHITPGMAVVAAAATAALWAIIYLVLTHFTDSSVPVADSFTTALSMVAMWALARKWAEQWLMWLVVDAVCAVLYVYKQIPFTAGLYAFYTVMAVAGYWRWSRQVSSDVLPQA